LIFIGIDVASEKHDIIMVDDYGEIIKDHFTISNDMKGFKKLHTEIKSCMKPIKDIHIGMEETGIYHENLRDFLISKGYSVYTINPLLTSYARKSSSVRRTKTDKIDCASICIYLMNNVRSLQSYTSSLYYIDELKQITRNYHTKKRFLAQSKSELKRLLHISFPEFKKHFNPLTNWSLRLLYDYPVPTNFNRVHISTIESKLRCHGNRHDKAIMIKTLAKDSIGKCQSTNVFLIKSCIEDIFHYSKQKDQIKKEITIRMKLFPILMSIPGVGPINGATILGETGNINRFPNKHAYYAYFGLDPVVHESGKYKLKKSKISKRGSKYLRTAAISISRVACVKCKDNKFQRKYTKLMKSGKHHDSALCAVAKNIVHSIYHLLKQNDTFDDNR
jgi:transposase